MSDDQRNDGAASPETLVPLEGEAGIPSVSAPRRAGVALKAIMAIVVVAAGLGLALYASVHQFASRGKSEAAENRKGPKAAATVGANRSFDSSKPPELADAKSSKDYAVVVPAIDTTEDVEVDPIGLRGQDANGSKSAVKRSPLDAPVLLALTSATDARGNAGVSSSDPPTDSSASSGTSLQELSGARSSLNQYQQQLQGMLGNLQKLTATGAAAPQSLSGASPPPVAPLGGQLSTAGTARVVAGHLGDVSLTLPRGTTFTCALKTKTVSEQSGLASCQVLRNVYSADGRVLLVDRGSHMDGEYTSRVKSGQSTIFVVWSRLRIGGITVDLGSPATGPLGEAGVQGYVDNHWPERIGAALMLSLVEDAAKIAAAEAGSDSNSSTAIVLGDSADTTANLSEKVLDAQINIPPTIYKLHGEVAGVYVAKDVDFSSVYELRTVAR